MEKLNEEQNPNGDLSQSDVDLMEQMENLMKIQNVKTDELLLGVVTQLLNSMISSTPDKYREQPFTYIEIKELKSILFNILNKYNDNGK